MTSAPMLIRMRRMMLIAASWPSNSAAAVTKRTLLVGRYSARALNSADRSVIAISPVRSTLGRCEVGGDIQRRRSAWRFLPPRGNRARSTVRSRNGAAYSQANTACVKADLTDVAQGHPEPFGAFSDAARREAAAREVEARQSAALRSP